MTNWFILVTYGTPKPELLAEVERQRRRFGFRLLHVRTDAGRGRHVEDLNASFEFSGYEEGLRTALAECRDDSEQPVQLVFANDTFSGAHLSLYTDNLFNWFFMARGRETLVPTFTGTKHALASGLAGFGDSGEYISTWFFGLIAPPAMLHRLNFVGVDQRGFRETVWPALPSAYREAIDEWLKPTSFFRGWYKAIPGKPLAQATLWRKRFAIYLEHDFARKAEEAGLVLRDPADDLPAFSRAKVRCLRFCDRLFVNILKLRIRLADSATIDV